MKPAWDKLMDAYASSSTALVADVDCTAAGQPLCQKNGVQGYPSIKYGTVGSLKDYQGGRDFDSLKKFADSNLGPQCGPDSLDACSKEDKKKYEEYMKLGESDLKALEAKIKETRVAYEKEMPIMKGAAKWARKKEREAKETERKAKKEAEKKAKKGDL